MSTSTRFAGVADLDVTPRDCFAVYEGLAASVRTSYANLGDTLDRLDTAPGSRLRSVLDLAPQVLTSAAGYCWLTAVYSTLAGNDRPGLDALLADFARFEAAAAVATGTDFEGDLARGPVTLPGTGMVVDVPGSGLRVVAGEPVAPWAAMPVVGSLRVDGFEPLLRNPRSMSQFGIAPGDPAVSRAGADELAAARELAAVVAPTLFDRYLTEVVPLIAEPGVAHAGTDDAAPWAVYLSFGREPADMLAALAHEESHALVQTLGKLVPDLLPDTDVDVAVPWKPGVRRTLNGVLHGLIAFGRTATVRARAARAGADTAANAEALEREMGWVDDVTSRLLDGALGELPDGLDAWLTANLAAVETDARPVEVGLEVLATDASGSTWFLLGGADVRTAADHLHVPVLRGRWHRGAPGYPQQDRGDLDALPPALLTDLVPALMSERTGIELELTSVKVHRLRSGDRITAHTDGEQDDLSHRFVLGLTPHDLRSGDLRLLTPERDPVVGTQPQFGQGLLFDVRGQAFHEVTTNTSPYPRYTAIASYRATK